MTDTLTIVGNVATDPVRSEIGGGVVVTNFRVASSQRRFDSSTQRWVEVGTNWYSVAAFRQLAEHAKVSLRTGDSVIVCGRLKVRSWERNGKQGMSLDIDAETIGHDLRWGTSEYARSSRGNSVPASAVAPVVPAGNAQPAADHGDEAVADPWSPPLTGIDELDQTPF